MRTIFKRVYGLVAQPSSYGHTTVKAPHPIRTAKLSIVGLVQYFGRGLRGNNQCCMAFLFLFLFLFFCPTFFFFAKYFFWQKRSRTTRRRCTPKHYIHEAEERNKIKFFESIQSSKELVSKNLYFFLLSSLYNFSSNSSFGVVW